MSRLAEISERLQAIAAELGGEEADDERAAELAREAAELSPRRSRRPTAACARPSRSERGAPL